MNDRFEITSPAGFTASELAATFAVLSDPTRIEMLRLLVTGDEVACTTFEAQFPISKSTISYHVKALRYAGLIHVRKEGKYYHYTLRREEIERRLPGLLALLASAEGDLATAAPPAGRRSHRSQPVLVSNRRAPRRSRASGDVVSRTG